MTHRITAVSANKDFQLIAHFSNGVAKKLDLCQLADENPIYGPGGYDEDQISRVYWIEEGRYVTCDAFYDADEGDCLPRDAISAEEIWEKGTEIQTPFSGLVTVDDAVKCWGISYSVLKRSIDEGALREDEDFMNIHGTVLFTKVALDRVYGECK